MVIFDFGFISPIIDICPIVVYLLLFIIIFIIPYGMLKSKMVFLCQKISKNFIATWYILVLFIFTIITIYNYEKFNIEKLNLETVIACSLIVLIMLPFFKKIVVFGNELESNLCQTSENLNRMEEAHPNNNEKLSENIEEDKKKMLQQLEDAKNNLGNNK